MTAQQLPPPIRVQAHDSVPTHTLLGFPPREPQAEPARLEPQRSFFRTEAVAAYAGESADVEPLVIVPLTTRMMLLSVAVLLMAALGLSAIGKVDLTARARGVLRGPEGVLPVMFEVGGAVRELRVREGDRVRRGDVLMRLDSTRMRAALVEAERQLTTTRERTERDDALARERFERDQLLLARRAEITRLRLKSQLASVTDLDSQVERDRGLSTQGLLAAQSARETDRLRNEKSRELLGQREELARLDQEVAALRQQYQAGRNQRRQSLEEATSRHDTARVLLSQTELVAARDGRVESLLVAVGDVVSPNVPVARLVPLIASECVVAFVPERDRAFVRVGQAVRVEIDQLPLGEFGSAGARIERVSSEIASRAELERALGAEAPRGASFRVELRLLRDAQTRQLTQRLSSGALVTARFALRERRLLGLLFDPLRRVLD
jgi:multidrug resistance efflux pump